MRRTDLIGTTMALSLAVFMSAVATGCGKNDIDTDITQSEVIETMATIESSEVEETPSVVAEYEVTNLQVPYVVMINTDTFLMDNPNTAGKLVDLAKESVVTVTGDVTFGGIATEFYYVDYQNGENIVSGYVDGKYIDFNSKVEDSMMGYSEVEGGDGVEETTEIEETETPTVAEMSTKSTEVLFNAPIAMYTTQNCNVRSRADKESELIMTLAKDVEIHCWGTDGDWSIVDCQGIKAYIHSTLLTETKPAPAQTTKPAEQSKPAQTQTPAQTTQQKPAETKPQTPSQPSGTITAVTPEGQTVTLTPNGKGWYKDQFGCPRDANGNRVSNIDGSPYQELPMGEGMYTGDIDSLLDNYNFSTN